jgi:DNA-directed RNA polymerase specialized sigma24 family protein
VERLLDKIVRQHYSHFLKTARDAIKAKPINPYDVVHEVITHLYGRDTGYINDIVTRGKMVQYIDRAIRVSVTSNSSNFYNKYVKFTAITCEYSNRLQPVTDYDYTDLINRENLDVLIQQLPKMERLALELYLLGYTYEELARETGIPVVYLYRVIKAAKKKINP